MFRKNRLTGFQHGSQEYQRIRMKIIDVITSGLLLVFPEILHLRKIYKPHCYVGYRSAIKHGRRLDYAFKRLNDNYRLQ